MPGHIKFIPGAAAAGKSYFLVVLILAMFYGNQKADRLKDSKPAEKKILYCECFSFGSHPGIY
jgi:hypothetical protein